MTEETPGKVMGLLGTALATMAFLFMVTVSNASFQGTQVAVPDPFASQNVVAMLDNVSHSYSDFLAANLFRPFQGDVAMVQDNANWVIDNSDQQVVAMLGLQALANPYGPMPQAAQPTVAGAFTDTPSTSVVQSDQPQSFSIDSLYYMLIR